MCVCLNQEEYGTTYLILVTSSYMEPLFKSTIPTTLLPNSATRKAVHYPHFTDKGTKAQMFYDSTKAIELAMEGSRIWNTHIIPPEPLEALSGKRWRPLSLDGGSKDERWFIREGKWWLD